MGVQHQPTMQITDFQKKCFDIFSEGYDSILIAPSSSGKTFITEKYIYDYFQSNYGKFLRAPRRIKICVVLPYKSIAVEEYSRFSDLMNQTGIKILLAVGGVKIKEEEIADSNIIVGTYEKILALIKKHSILLKYLKMLVIDEFHFLGTQRGGVIEEILLEIKKHDNKTQLILLSSSIANPIEIADWLNVYPILEKERPIPLKYAIESSRNFIDYIQENQKESKPLIVFCNSRSNVEELATKIANPREKNAKIDITETFKELFSANDDKKLKELVRNTYFPEKLKEIVKKRVGYHHAGLSDIVRLLVEEMYKNGDLDILVSTSTLAAGVNLPAETAIFIVHNNRMKIENNLVFQTLGRAGRLGYSDKGQGVVLVSGKNFKDRTEKKLFNMDKKGENKPIYNSLNSQLGNYDYLVKLYLENIVYSKDPFSSKIEHLVENIEDSFWFYKNKSLLMRHSADYEIFNAFFSSAESILETQEIIDFYKRYDKARNEKEKKMVITSIEGIDKGIIVANIREQSKLFQLYLSPSRRSCTCQNKHSNFLCKHQRYLLKEYPSTQDRWLNNYGIIDFLIKEGFVVRSSGRRLNPTTIGKLAASFFVHPYNFLDYLEFCSTAQNQTISQYLRLFICKDQGIRQSIRSNELNTLKTIRLAQEIAKGKSVRELCKKYNLSDSFIEDFSEKIYRMLKMIQFINYFLGKRQKGDEIEKWLSKSQGLESLAKTDFN